MRFYIQTERTALVLQKGHFNSSTKAVVICLHGFAELASDFIDQFNPLVEEGYCIIAPEALSRSYFNKHSTIGASWMTKHEREYEIQDYIHYLNKVFFEFYLSKQLFQIPVYVLGFSQGVATACRWIAKDQSKVDGLILCSGTPATDTELKDSKNFKQTIHVLYGNEDPLISPAQLEQAKEYWTNQELSPKIQAFSGKHELNIPLISSVLKQLSS